MKKLLRIKENQNKTFQNIARQFNIEYQLIKQLTDSKGRVQFCYNITSPIVISNLKTVNSYINLQVNHNQAVLNAKVLYSLYATLNLKIVDFKYPTYNHFFNDHIDIVDGDESQVSIDHILPISTYPQLTFSISNWVNMSKENNKDKGNKADPVNLLKYHDKMAELVQSFIA